MYFPKVSIIVPVYKVKAYIKRCIESVIGQTYSNIELILVDDFDEEKSLDVVANILKSSLIDYKIINHIKNKGLSEARNSGIKIATGEYLFFLDSDDELPSKAIEYLISNAVQFKSEVVMGTLGWIEENKSIKYYGNPKMQINGNRNVLEYISNNSVLLIGCNKLIKREFLVNNKIYFYPRVYHEDLLYSFLLFSKLNSISFIEDVTYCYYIRKNSITTMDFDYKKLESFKRIVSEMRILIKDKNEKALYRLYKSRCFTMMQIAVNGSNDNHVIDCMKEIVLETDKKILYKYTGIKDFFKVLPFIFPNFMTRIYLNLLKYK